jgi:glycerol-3-phosphate acyltransferase PlsY
VSTSLGWLLAILASYLLGAVPFGLVLVRLKTGKDLRDFGSGNIGATNAMRAAGKAVGVLSFLLDAGKGIAPVLLFPPLVPGDPGAGLAVACGAAAVLGHCFPVYLGFKGGKGVATGCGALMGLDFWLFPIGGAVWLVTLVATRYVGLASIAMGITFPIAAWIHSGGERPEVVLGASLLTLLILIRHRSNMARMLAGTEPKALTRKGAGS